MKPLLVKGVPSLINDMKIVYKDQQKAAIIGQVLSRWNENMEKELVLNQEDQEEQDPTVQLWLYYFLSQHHLRLGHVEEALAFINKAIKHTPTVVELYLHKAKIF